MNEKQPYNKEQQANRKRAKNFAVGLAIGAFSFATLKYQETLQATDDSKKAWFLVGIAAAAGACTVMGGTLEAYAQSRINRNNGDDDEGNGGWGKGKPDPIMPQDGPGGIEREVSGLTVEDILSQPQTDQEKVLLNT